MSFRGPSRGPEPHLLSIPSLRLPPPAFPSLSPIIMVRFLTPVACALAVQTRSEVTVSQARSVINDSRAPWIDLDVYRRATDSEKTVAHGKADHRGEAPSAPGPEPAGAGRRPHSTLFEMSQRHAEAKAPAALLPAARVRKAMAVDSNTGAGAEEINTFLTMLVVALVLVVIVLSYALYSRRKVTVVREKNADNISDASSRTSFRASPRSPGRSPSRSPKLSPRGYGPDSPRGPRVTGFVHHIAGAGAGGDIKKGRVTMTSALQALDN